MSTSTVSGLPAATGPDGAPSPGTPSPPLPPVSVVVVAFRSRGTIEACLASLAASRYPGPIETIVVDNASGDGSAELVAERFPGVRLVREPRNLGFAGGVVAGYRVSTGEVVALLNPDAIVEPDWLAELVSGLLSDRSIGLAGSLIFDADGRTIQHAGGRLRSNALSEHIGRGESDPSRYASPMDVEYATGAALALRRSTIEAFGFLDPGYFPAYYEEAELAVRLRRAGLKVVVFPKARLRHVEAASSGGTGTSFHEAYHRGRLRFVFKTASPGEFLFRFAPAEARWILRSVPAGTGGALARAWFGTLLRLPLILGRRLRGEKVR